MIYLDDEKERQDCEKASYVLFKVVGIGESERQSKMTTQVSQLSFESCGDRAANEKSPLDAS